MQVPGDSVSLAISERIFYLQDKLWVSGIFMDLADKYETTFANAYWQVRTEVKLRIQWDLSLEQPSLLKAHVTYFMNIMISSFSFFFSLI